MCLSRLRKVELSSAAFLASDVCEVLELVTGLSETLCLCFFGCGVQVSRLAEMYRFVRSVLGCNVSVFDILNLSV